MEEEGAGGGPGSFAGSTQTGRSAKRMRQARPDVRRAKRSTRCGGRRRGWCSRETRARGEGGRSPRKGECERVDVPSNQECASAVAGHPDGCPAVGAPRPRSPASRAARPRAPRRTQGDRARRSSRGERTKGSKQSRGHRPAGVRLQTTRPGQSPGSQAAHGRWDLREAQKAEKRGRRETRGERCRKAPRSMRLQKVR